MMRESRTFFWLGAGLIMYACSSGTVAPNEDVVASDVSPAKDAAVDVQEDTASPPSGPVDLTVSLAPPEAGYQIVTPPTVVPSGTEVEICSVVRVQPNGDGKLFWVNEMESLISENSHHMNVLFGQFSLYDAVLGEDAFEARLGIGIGTYDCNEIDTIMEQAFPIFPSQRTNQRITFPEGVGVPMLAPLVLVFHHHYINVTLEDVVINAALNIYEVDEEDVQDVGFLVFESDLDLDIPGMSQKTEGKTCVMNQDLNVALVSTHTHEKAGCATLNHYSAGSQDVQGDPFFVNKYWEAPPLLHFERGEFTIQAGDGIHFACHYDNSEDRTLNFGPSAKDEMCVLAVVGYPAKKTKAEITDIINNGGISAILELSNDLLGGCDEVIDAQSPWPHTAEANFGDFVDSCQGYEQTDSNTLW